MQGVAIIMSAAVVAVSAAPSFQYWMRYPDSPNGTMIWRDNASQAYCFATVSHAVDADGAPNAYHPDDVNRLKPPFLGLDNPVNAGWRSDKSTGWHGVLADDPHDRNKPYRQKDGPFAGYFVAATALRAKTGLSTDPSTYVDARNVPYIVLPGPGFANIDGTGAPGDVGIVWNLKNGSRVAFVIGDTGGSGPNPPLGEGSIALFERLGGKNIEARHGTGVAPGVMRYVVFRNSRKALGWPASNEQITALADKLLISIGGESSLSKCSL